MSENIFDHLPPMGDNADEKASPAKSEQSPFEAIFNLQPTSTPLAHESAPEAVAKIGGALVDPATGEIMQQTVDPDAAELDKEARLEDLKLQAQLDTVHDAAMGAFNQQQTMSQEVDPKFSARNAEVAAQFLGIALQSVTARSEAKYKREKMRLAKNIGGSPQSVQNNVIVASRGDVLRSLFRPDFERTMAEQISSELDPKK